MLIKLTPEEWIAGVVVTGNTATRQADGNDYEVTVPENAAFMTYQLTGPADGSIKVTGDGDGGARRSGTGDGDAWRDGTGHGGARRGGAGLGCAGRSGTGIGNAYVRGVKQ